ncbi:MAG: hypothetical protein L6R39_006576 [Caloplaca ligustica]|nr:MAG: hypothetical protein L6R39_006576 [Caloplaca ligustica]
MSAGAVPIPLERFAEAIAELPLGNLHAKAAELHNSITHLVSSNEQLQEYADDGDQDCTDAIKENEEVIGRMQARINLLKNEVQNRGFLWGEDEPATVNGKGVPGYGDGEISSVLRSAVSGQSPRTQGGSLGDEELARRLQQQMDENMQDGDDDDGVHL